MISFLVIYLLEASFRKYLLASALTVVVKYFPLLLYFSKRFQKSSLSMLIIILLPLFLLVPSVEGLQFAIYDFLSIAIIPLIIVLITRVKLAPRQKIKVLCISAFGGFANSLMIIAQFFVGPNHFLSQTVDQQFTQHTYLADLYQKAPGIAASSSSYIAIAGLIATLSLYNVAKAPTMLLHINIIVISLSVVFNLPSRSYVLGIALFAIIYLFLSFLRQSFYSAFVRSLLIGSPIFYFYNLFSKSQDFQSVNRLNDFESVVSRIPQFFPFEQFEMSLPLFGGSGLGSTINNNLLSSSTLDVLPQCQSYFKEYEFTRYVCSFGLFGYVVIASRFFLSLLLAFKALTLFRSSRLIQAAGLFYISSQFFLSASFKINDVASGLLIIAISSVSAVEIQDK